MGSLSWTLLDDHDNVSGLRWRRRRKRSTGLINDKNEGRKGSMLGTEGVVAYGLITEEASRWSGGSAEGPTPQVL